MWYGWIAKPVGTRLRNALCFGLLVTGCSAADEVDDGLPPEGAGVEDGIVGSKAHQLPASLLARHARKDRDDLPPESDGAGGSAGTGDDGGTPPPATGFMMNFKPPDAPDVVGYLQDAGQLYGTRDNGRNYGWSVSHMERGSNEEPIAGYGWAFPHWSRIQMLPSAQWEIAVPNGAYQVLVGGSGCNTAIGVLQQIVVEGVLVLNKTPSVGCYDTYDMYDTAIVWVGDGRLTLTNGEGAVGSLLAYLRVSPK